MKHGNRLGYLSILGPGAFALIIFFCGAVYAKSVYLVADHHGNPTPINVYEISAGGYPLNYQATHHVTSQGLGASGLAFYNDPDGNPATNDGWIFVTYESSNIVEAFDATDLSNVGNFTAPGASNLAGIVVDQGKRLVYTIDRNTKNLFIYDANSFTLVDQKVLSDLNKGGIGLALDETQGWLFVTDLDSTVHYFDTTSWAQVDTISTKSIHAIGIAYDEKNQYVYTGGAFSGDRILSKYEIKTGIATSIDLSQVIPGMGAMGLALDPDTSYLYVTTGYSGDDLRVFDSDLNEVYLHPDLEGMILNPAGICIPPISFNELNLDKEDGLEPGGSVPSGSSLTYEISFDNTKNPDKDVHNVVLDDTLPTETKFLSATGGGVYDPCTHMVTWDVGTLLAGAPKQIVELEVKVLAPPGSTIVNYCRIDSDETVPTTESEATDISDIPAVACISPRSYLALGNWPVTFGVYDPDLASINVTTGEAHFLFDGTSFNMTSLDAVDLVMGDRPEETKFLFSVREDHLLTSPDGSTFLLKKCEVAELDIATGLFKLVFSGCGMNLHCVDAVSLLDDGRIVFSPDGDFFYMAPSNPPIFFKDRDLAVYDPATDTIDMYLRGSDIGISTLDGVDIEGGMVYFSVRKPIYIFSPGGAVYLKDGDIGMYDPATGSVMKYLNGNPYFVYNIDALSIGYVPAGLNSPSGPYIPPMAHKP